MLMKKTKLIASIVSVCIGAFAFLQSCFISFLEELDGMNSDDSTLGIMLGFIMLVTGIVGICTKKKSRWLCLGFAIAYSIAGRLGLAGEADFGDLGVYAFVCFALTAVFVVLFFIEISVPKETSPHEQPDPKSGTSYASAPKEQTKSQSPKETTNTKNSSVADTILKYKSLLDMGAITEEEYNAKKDELLHQ